MLLRTIGLGLFRLYVSDSSSLNWGWHMTFTVGLTLSGTASKALSPSHFLCVCNSPETKCPSWLVFSCGLYNRHNKFYLIFFISDVSFDPSQMYIMDSFLSYFSYCIYNGLECKTCFIGPYFIYCTCSLTRNALHHSSIQKHCVIWLVTYAHRMDHKKIYMAMSTVIYSSLVKGFLFSLLLDIPVLCPLCAKLKRF